MTHLARAIQDPGPAADRPALVGVMGCFANLAASRNWRGIEDFFNPGRAFREVHLVSMGDNHRYETTRFGSVVVHPVRSPAERPALRVPNNLYLMVQTERRVRRVVREHRVELVAQIFGGPLKFGLPAVVAAARSGLPSVISLHNDYPRLMAWTYSAPLRWASGMVWRYLFRNCTRVRSVSAYIADFAHRAGVPQERVRVIPNKEDLDKFRLAPTPEELEGNRTALGLGSLPPDAVLFLTVARLVVAKNHEGMIRAFARVARRHRNVYYLVAGNGPLEGRLRRLAQELGVAERVRFLGFLSHAQLRAVYHLSDVFLFATHYEGQPRALVEAILAKLPVVCSEYGQACELIRNGEDGVWADPRAPESIAAAMEGLVADPALRRRMGQHASFDAGRYAVPEVGRQEAALYLSVIEEARAAQAPATVGAPPSAALPHHWPAT